MADRIIDGCTCPAGRRVPAGFRTQFVAAFLFLCDGLCTTDRNPWSNGSSTARGDATEELEVAIVGFGCGHYDSRPDDRRISYYGATKLPTSEAGFLRSTRVCRESPRPKRCCRRSGACRNRLRTLLRTAVV